MKDDLTQYPAGTDAESVEQLLAEYVDGTLPADLVRLVEEAAEKNAALKEEIELARFASVSLKDLPATEMPAELTEKILDRTTRRISWPQRISNWFRYIPAPAYALVMIAVIASVVVYKQFGPVVDRRAPESSVEIPAAKMPLEEEKDEAPKPATDAAGTTQAVPKGVAEKAEALLATTADKNAVGFGHIGDQSLPAAGEKAGTDAPADSVAEYKEKQIRSGGREQTGVGKTEVKMAGTTTADATVSLSAQTRNEAPPPPAPLETARIGLVGGAGGGRSYDRLEGTPALVDDEQRNRKDADKKVQQPVASGGGYGSGTISGFGGIAASPPAAALSKAGPAKKSGGEEGKVFEKERKEDAAASIRIVHRLDGAHGGWTHEGSVLATNEESLRALWKKIWATRMDPPLPPLVDFSRQVVVAVGLGTMSTGGYAVKIVSVRLEGNVLYVKTMRTEPHPGDIVTESLTQPYSLVVVDLGGPVPASLRVRFEP